MIPTSFLQKTARELEKTTVMLIGISILLCILLANIMARGITRPIEKTSNAMKNLQKEISQCAFRKEEQMKSEP